MQNNSNNINKIDLILHKNNIATVPIRSGVFFSPKKNIRKIYDLSLGDLGLIA